MRGRGDTSHGKTTHRTTKTRNVQSVTTAQDETPGTETVGEIDPEIGIAERKRREVVEILTKSAPETAIEIGSGKRTEVVRDGLRILKTGTTEIGEGTGADHPRGLH